MSFDENKIRRQAAGQPTGGQFAPCVKPENDQVVLDKDWGRLNLGEGSRTPWGPADQVEHFADGIAFAHAPGHGGIKLSPQRNREVHPALRRSDGWYEEDCNYHIAAYAFPEEFAPHWGSGRTPEYVAETSAESLRYWFPDEWEKVTGEKVTAEQSRVVAEREFLADHHDDFIVRSAAFAKDNKVKVEARRPSDGAEKTFLVSNDTYAQRGTFGYVIDEATDKDITPPPAPPKPVVPTKRYRSARTVTDGLAASTHARVENEMNQVWRLPEGGRLTTTELIESGRISGKTMRHYNGKNRYSLSMQENEGESSYGSLPVSAATFKALVDIPDVRTPLEKASHAIDQAITAEDRARNREAEGFYEPLGTRKKLAAATRRAMKRREQAESDYRAARDAEQGG